MQCSALGQPPAALFLTRLVILLGRLTAADARTLRHRRQPLAPPPQFLLHGPLAPAAWHPDGVAATLPWRLTPSSSHDDDGDTVATTPAGGLSHPRVHNAGPDMIMRATLQVQRQTDALNRAQANPPLVSRSVCAQAAERIGAMSCSLVTQVSGYPEGCECRVEATECPPVVKDLGFTGLSPSFPIPVNNCTEGASTSVVLCMYWQWQALPDRTQEDQDAYYETRRLAEELVRTAHIRAMLAAKTKADPLWALLPPPVVYTTPYPLPGRNGIESTDATNATNATNGTATAAATNVTNATNTTNATNATAAR